MEMTLPLVAGVIGAGYGWVAAANQHLLYGQREFRTRPSAGRGLLLRRIFLAFSCALGTAASFRPDHYDILPSLLTSLFVCLLLTLASTDLERKIVPNRVVYPAIALAFATSWAWPDRTVADVLLGGAFAFFVGGLLFGFGLLTAAVLRLPGVAFGMGDVKLILLIGLLCGWPAVLAAVVFGFLLTGLAGVVLLVTKGARAHFPLAPYLVVGGLIVLIWPGPFTA